MTEIKKNDYEYLHWISSLKSYCCGCFTDDTIEEVNQTTCDNSIGNIHEILVLENNTKDLSLIVVDEDEFITIDETDVKCANDEIVSENKIGSNANANANETGPGPTKKSEDLEDSITKIEDKVIAQANDNYF